MKEKKKQCTHSNLVIFKDERGDIYQSCKKCKKRLPTIRGMVFNSVLITEDRTR